MAQCGRPRLYPGKTAIDHRQVAADFFDHVEEMLNVLHARRIIYVDLHKQENVLVGDDGLPYLIDFQVSVQLPNTAVCQPLFRGRCATAIVII